ncbi:unnamed protein product [Rotaria sp. Silwood2]|nr:unnamed protein product [Rotaria sp. Silwood2]CAF4597468.1 unnamed protein product [Rotaria sp. Silwood2]
MAAWKILIHYDRNTELLDVPDLNIVNVDGLLKQFQRQLYEESEDFLIDFGDCLCEGPYAREPLDDYRFREIVNMLEQLMPLNALDPSFLIERRPIELWLCNCNKTNFVRHSHLLIFCNILIDSNNGFLDKEFLNNNTLPVQEQPLLDNNALADLNMHHSNMNSQLTYSRFTSPEQPPTEMELIQNIPSQNGDYGEVVFDFLFIIRKAD